PPFPYTTLFRSSSIDSNIDIDLDLLTKKTNDNPVFYVQYAQSRTRAVDRNAAAAGVTREGFDPSLLAHATESELPGALAEFPRITLHAVELREPHRIARSLEALARADHRWYGSR